jgi:hypothetical protein
MFHVKHLRCPFVIKPATIVSKMLHLFDLRLPARDWEGMAAPWSTYVRQLNLVGETLPFYAVVTRSPESDAETSQEVSSSPTVLTGHLGLDFSFYKDAGCALVFAAEGESIDF